MDNKIEKVLVTGANGFIGSNLVKLLERKNYEVLKFDKNDSEETLYNYINQADFIYHFAAIQRPDNFDYSPNEILSQKIINFLLKKGLKTPIFFSSSIHAEQSTPYGLCKKREESVFIEFAERNESKVYICRFSNIFGPGSKPHYTSVVATFIYDSIVNNPITINDINATINLIFIEDVEEYLVSLLLLPDDYNVINYLNCYHTTDLISLLFIIKAIKNNNQKYLEMFDEKFVSALKKTYDYFKLSIEGEKHESIII